MRGGVDQGHPLWGLTPFIDNPGSGPGWTYEFEWEREWRVPGGLRFTLLDIRFLFAPEDEHERLRQKWPSWNERGEPFSGAIIDTSWTIEDVQAELIRAGVQSSG
ncbi:hypothetical protein SAMN04488000_11418 [Lentzea albida]|uniref:Uncharacterized protein n=2 Tax=Lentzea albida TaxID=65499 RepID=A0A1H9TJC5_9PSEU|nr:hypothetical protein SAMN04488000_11418 [Lentzea albida]